MFIHGPHMALQQTTRVIAVALIAGMVFLLVQSWWLLSAAERDFATLRTTTALSLRSALSNALWNLDEPTAHALLEDTVRAKPVSAILVVDESQKVFASIGRDEGKNSFSGWESLLYHLMHPVVDQRVDLTRARPRPEGLASHAVPAGAAGAVFHGHGGGAPGASRLDARDALLVQVIGHVYLTYDARLFIKGIAGRLADQTLGMLFVIVVVAGATSLVMHGFLARHLVAAARAVERIDPEDPAARPLGVPEVHRRNEFGRMVRRLNALLERLAVVQAALRHMATRDALTGLPNRSLILEIIDRALADAPLEEGHVAVMFLDLDMFKHVNDSLGHEAGDEVLQEVARRLGSVLVGVGTAGRLGGDEFVIIVEGRRSIEDLARLARRVIAAVKRPVEVAGTVVHPSTSVGIACHPQDGAGGQDLLRNADTAMYAAKAAGPGQWAFFERAMTENALIRLRTEGSLRAAVDRGEFVLHFQPKVDLGSGRVAGCEALVRWRHGGELVAPGRFIPIAEETGLIYDIGLWVLREACRVQAQWKTQFGPLSMAVNVSARQLSEPSFLDDFMAVLRANRVDLDLLELEITESAIMSQFNVSAQLLREIKALGVRLSVDDFGTGYSSLAYLKNLPIDVLKIDRSFVSDLPGDTSIPRMIIGLSGQLGLRTVAEGIETREQFDWLRDNGCHMVQGYLVSRPLPEEAFLPFCRTWRAEAA
ncbi:putative bifunctional diguanylate cyclase/phosphodiesterase [Pararhodospirillum oryzae]|uniref:GGDEF-domain containing protein n=1 Tax=Pararhodospirillum oryzae TaxID=478448 RepID=A0A512H4Y6_9PROT|nr:EAL domain-containing protein [Pararhodospirillum oryzae]GEO80488.1 GGDEF-domain containing protein [Pararhodospirillum oryzae]